MYAAIGGAGAVSTLSDGVSVYDYFFGAGEASQKVGGAEAKGAEAKGAESEPDQESKNGSDQETDEGAHDDDTAVGDGTWQKPIDV